MKTNRNGLVSLSVSAGVLAAACVVHAQNVPGRGGRGPAPTPKPTIAAPGSDQGDSSKSKELPTVFSEENSGANLPQPKAFPTMESATVIKPFPDPFAYMSDPLGKTRSTSYADWEKHRQEMMAMIEHYEIGDKPVVDVAKQVTATFTPAPPPNAQAASAAAPASGARGPFGGRGRGGPPGGPGSGTLVVKVTGPGEPLTLTCNINVPIGAKAPYPVLITMGGSSLPPAAFSSRGIAIVTYNYNSVTQDGRPSANDAYHKLYPDEKFSSNSVQGNSGQYSAWAWGVSRVIDGLELTKDKFPVDLKHMAVTGCSRAGKLALFAGALDERVALTVAQESGGGGATNWRFSATEPPDPSDPSGKKLSVEGITNTDHAWFASQMFKWGAGSLDKLPEDHHMLTALVAPRALYVTGNTDYTWLSNPSLYVNSQATAKVYSTLGIADRFGYVVNGQHAHCNFPASQNEQLDYFLDRFMKDDTGLSKIVAAVPEEFAKIDYARWTQWWGTGDAVLPALKEGASK
ncbi:MAG TPA: hypothetical protein VH253_12975 [Phycisphaerae bacterium]|nr:hypothetical protein [Phycisphaerae bacterium]